MIHFDTIFWKYVPDFLVLWPEPQHLQPLKLSWRQGHLSVVTSSQTQLHRRSPTSRHLSLLSQNYFSQAHVHLLLNKMKLWPHNLRPPASKYRLVKQDSSDSDPLRPPPLPPPFYCLLTQSTNDMMEQEKVIKFRRCGQFPPVLRQIAIVLLTK